MASVSRPLSCSTPPSSLSVVATGAVSGPNSARRWASRSRSRASASSSRCWPASVVASCCWVFSRLGWGALSSACFIASASRSRDSCGLGGAARGFQHAQVVQADGDLQMLRPQVLAAQRQTLFQMALGLVVGAGA